MFQTWHYPSACADPISLLTLFMVLLAAMIVAPAAVSAPKRPTLNVATWDVSTAPETAFAKPKRAKKPRWRTTFGSERRDRAKRGNARFDIDADVVLIQGVRNIGALRRVFSSRHWRLILSHDYTANAPRLGRLPADLRSYDIARHDAVMTKAVTAIAVRYQRGVRVRGVKPLSALVDRSAASTSSRAPRAIAVRLFFKGRKVWLASVPVMATCKAKLTDCISDRRKQWRSRLKSNATPLIAGLAPMAVASEPDTPDDVRTCAAAVYRISGQSSGVTQLTTAASKYETLGCFRSVKVP